MAKLVWALLCGRVIIDGQTNLVSYIDALDAVAVSKFPIVAPPVLVGTLWQRGTEKRMEMRVQVYAPSGTPLKIFEAEPLDFKPEHKRARMNCVVAGFDMVEPGRYEFGIETRDKGKWIEVHRVPFDVDSAQQT